MQISTVLGIVIGFVVLIGGVILKGAQPASLINPAAIMIIMVGTTAALLNAFPMAQFTKLFTMFRLVFSGQKLQEKEEIAKMFVKYSYTVRKDGILALENVKFENSFMAMGISMVVDGVDEEAVTSTMEKQIEAMESRHKLGATIFAQAGMYAPTLGVMGAVIGLVAALGNLNDVEALGHAIAGAFIATLFGIFTGYVLWHPFSNKLKQMSKEEVELKEMIMEGVKALQSGTSSNMMQVKMLAFIPDKRKQPLMDEWSKSNG